MRKCLRILRGGLRYRVERSRRKQAGRDLGGPGLGERETQAMSDQFSVKEPVIEWLSCEGGALRVAETLECGQDENGPGLKPFHCKGFVAEAEASASHRTAEYGVLGLPPKGRIGSPRPPTDG